MCGRFVLTYSTDDLVSEFEVGHVVEPDLAPSWNVAPTQPVRIVTERYGEIVGGAASDRAPVRELRTARWGLVPHWAKDRAIGSKMINARSESVAEKPAFRTAANRRRCLVPANGYYEWMVEPGRGGPGKAPYYLHDPNGEMLAMAGLFEIWRDDSVPANHPDHLLLTTTVITRPAPDSLGHIHDRSPVVVPRELRDEWLNCPAPGDEGRPNEAVELLAEMPPPTLVPREVGKAVGNVRNNAPSLIEPVAAGPDGLF